MVNSADVASAIAGQVLLLRRYGVHIELEYLNNKVRVLSQSKYPLTHFTTEKNVANFLNGVIQGVLLARETFLNKELCFRYTIIRDDPDEFFAVLADDGGKYSYQVYTDHISLNIPEVEKGIMRDRYDAEGLLRHLKQKGEIGEAAFLLPCD